MQNRGEESRASIRKGGTPFDYLSLVPAAPWLEALALVRVHWGGVETSYLKIELLHLLHL